MARSKLLRLLLTGIVFAALTILTQTGGLIYLLAFITHGFITKNIRSTTGVMAAKMAAFISIYLLATLAILPTVAPWFGRVPLAWNTSHNLEPLNVLTCLLNRNYVRPSLRDAAYDVAQTMATQYPGTTLCYLDANFPFIDKFPLFPHLSHNDGKKLDLAFCYRETKTMEIVNSSPSAIGYGVCEEPATGEENMPAYCAKCGYWNYNLLRKIVSQADKEKYMFDADRTRAVVELFAAEPAISKIFIEPHLKARLHLNIPKIKFHGCHAVRHDDHIHVQVD